MRIIIVGSGKVGTALIDHLAKEGHSLVVIDSDSEVIENLINKYDIKGVCGNGTSFEIQKEAGVDGADLVIAVTSGDEVNILTCLFAKKSRRIAYHRPSQNTGILRTSNPFKRRPGFKHDCQSRIGSGG